MILLFLLACPVTRDPPPRTDESLALTPITAVPNYLGDGEYPVSAFDHEGVRCFVVHSTPPTLSCVALLCPAPGAP